MERMTTINQRIAERTQGSLPPIYFSPRPVPTKYVALPMLDQRPPPVPLTPKIFDIQKNFLPSSSTPGYSHYVDTESNLMREQHYFPSSSSSMYVSNVSSRVTENPHPLLSARPTMPEQPRGLPRQWCNESTSIKSLNIH
jgi:hypothetical protein